jgi:hypothetical protein
MSVVAKLETPQAATILLNGLDQTKELGAHGVQAALADGLMTIADRMDQPEAATIRRRAFEIIVTNPAASLGSVAERMQPADAAQILVKAIERETTAHICNSQASALVMVSARLDPAQAARVCGQAAQILATRLAQEKDAGARAILAGSLESFASRMEPAQTARICGQAATTIATTLEWEKDARARAGLARGLESLASRMEPAQAARICGQAATMIEAALEWEKDADACAVLAGSLESLASRMEPAQATRICEQLARRLIPDLERIPSTVSFKGIYGSPGASWLPLVSTRMDPTEASSMLAAALDRAENPDVLHELVLGLVSLAGRQDAVEAGRICRQAARVLIASLGRKTNAPAARTLTEDVLSVVSRLDKTEAAQICGQAAQVLAVAIAREADAPSRSSLASALATISARLAPSEAAHICGPAARTLADALEREKDANARYALASGLESLAGLMDQSGPISPLVAALIREANDNRLASDLASLAGRSDPPKAARIYRQAARVLATALKYEKLANERNALAEWLALLAGRFDPAEAARIYSQATRALADALTRETDDRGPNVMAPMNATTIDSSLSSMVTRMASADAVGILVAALKAGANPPGRTRLARILFATMDRLNAAEADRVCEELIGSLDGDSFDSIAPELLPQLNPGRAHALAWGLASRMCSEQWFDIKAFSQILTDTSREQRTRRAARMAASAGPGLEGMLEAAARLSAEPFPCRLTTQELVELLKMPTCFGEDRRIVLDHLGNRFRHRFINHWAFVRFATEQKLGLDFTTPPRRPDPKGSARRMRPRKAMGLALRACEWVRAADGPLSVSAMDSLALRVRPVST